VFRLFVVTISADINETLSPMLVFLSFLRAKAARVVDTVLVIGENGRSYWS